MELWALVLCVLPTIVTSITISPNGNSPEIKMVGGMMVDVQKGFSPINEKSQDAPKTNQGKRKLTNSPKLSINERYRRLIPYMTFYYANDLVTPTTESHTKNVEVEKAEIIEAKTIQNSEQRQPKKIVYSSNRNIPLYQGNRLTQFNIASANPTKLYYKEIVPAHATPVKNTQNFNPLLSEHRLVANNENFEFERFPQKQIVKSPSVPFSPPSRRPYLNLYNDDTAANIQYYFPDKNQAPRYKLVPYEQTPPVKVVQNENVFNAQKLPTPVPVLIPKEQIYIKARPVRPQFYYENVNIPQTTTLRKQPAIVSESYYEKARPQTAIVQPLVESGFKPIARPVHTTEVPIYKASIPETPIPHFESEKEVIEPPQVVPETEYKPNYHKYVVKQSTYKPPQHASSNTITLADLLNTLQLNKSIPKPITKENVGASIRTLLQVLNALKAAVPDQDVEDIPILSTPKPFIPNKVVDVDDEPIVGVTPTPIADEETDFQDEPYLAPVHPPSQHIDADFPTSGGTSQRFPLPVSSDDEGGTPGRPGIDYPILTTIPHTAFDCKTQRYKGFFADPETRCQVWHYCDLNGGQASFLCPNGTIFSQAGLTCDWWFNVKCASTAQLYVLNESLYKYILPHSPKFPEDYSGPLVDKYLTLKFKEMEEQFKKNKNKQSAAEKIDSDEENSTEETGEKESESSDSAERTEKTSAVSEASVIVGNAGASGNVERLQD